MAIDLDHFTVPSRNKTAAAKLLAELLGVPWAETGAGQFSPVYISAAHGPVDRQIDTRHGGRIVYWNDPDGHYWEMLTVSYARRTK